MIPLSRGLIRFWVLLAMNLPCLPLHQKGLISDLLRILEVLVRRLLVEQMLVSEVPAA